MAANSATFAERQDYPYEENYCYIRRRPSNWGAYTPDDIGSVVVTASTREKVIEQFRSALDFHLRGMREDGMETPGVMELEIREIVAA